MTTRNGKRDWVAAAGAGLFNARDVGGDQGAGGGRVRSGLLFRSGAPDYAQLNTLPAIAAAGIGIILDFRASSERVVDPTATAKASGIDYVAPNAADPIGDPVTALKRCSISAAATHDLMHQVYRRIALDQASAYRDCFRLLLERDQPILLHCASGKDRTGVFVALVQHLLGVAQAAVKDEYLRSNAARDDIIRAFRAEERNAELIKAPAEVWAPLMGCEFSYLATSFAALAERHGSVEAFCEDQLGVDAAARNDLRRRYLTDGN